MPKDPSLLRPQKSSSRSSPKLIFDWEEWLPYLADKEASDEERRAMIDAVWIVVMAFADLEWEIRGRDGSEKDSCGQVLDLKAVLEAAVLNSREMSPEKAQKPTDHCSMPPPCGEEDAA